MTVHDKYIRRLELNSSHELVISYSDGTELNVGYMPLEDGIRIFYKERIDNDRT